MDGTPRAFTPNLPKSQAWSTYKERRREEERERRLKLKERKEHLMTLAAQARAEGKVLVRAKQTPYRKYAEHLGGRAAARNAEFKRPAVGNRKVFHKKEFWRNAHLVKPLVSA